MSASSPFKIASVVDFLRLRSQLSVGAYCLFIYDTLICYSDEYSYIWGAKLNIGKILYLGVRYGTLVNTTLKMLNSFVLISTEVRRTVFFIENILGLALLALTLVTFSLRTYALWEKSRLILYTLTFVAVVGPLFEIMFVLYKQDKFTLIMINAQGFGQVLPIRPRWYTTLWFSPLAFDLFILLLTMLKVYRLAHSGVKSPLLSLLFQDGFLYFLVVFGSTSVNLILSITRTTGMSAFLGYHRVLVPIMTCRLLLNLRGTATRSSVCTTYASTKGVNASYMENGMVSTTIKFARIESINSFDEYFSESEDTPGEAMEEAETNARDPESPSI